MDNIKIFANEAEYITAGKPTTESRVALVESDKQLKYDGVNVEVSLPKEGDYVYRDAEGNVHFITKESVKNNLIPAGWVFIDIFYYGWADEVFVDMGLPSGVKWAKSNLDVTQASKMAKSAFQYDCSFFSWGNIDGHNPTSASSFSPYSWGGINAQEPWYDGQVYGSTPGAALAASFAADSGYDAVRENLGAPYRMPTNDNHGELFNSANIDYITEDGEIVTAATSVAKTAADKRVRVNGIVGLYIRSKANGKRLFFACSGYGNGTSRDNRGSYGNYWSSAWSSARNARSLGFYSGGVYPQNSSYRYLGFAVRAVQ